MATAKKLPSGNWRVRVYSYTDTSGKKHYESFTAPTKREAEYQAANFARNKEETIRPDNLTIREALSRYIELKEAVLSPSSIRGYRSLERSAYDSILARPIRSFSSAELQIWVSDYARNRNPKTVRNAYGLLLSSILLFDPDSRLKATLPARKKPELRTPSDADIKKLLAAIEGTELEAAVLLAAFGPLRRGEICALESSDIQGNVISVSKSMVINSEKEWVIKQPKTYGSYRDVTFPDFVINKLPQREGRIFTLNPNTITTYFGKVIRNTDIPLFRFHDLRHYAASIMHALGMPDQYIMERGGWRSDHVMKRVYRGVIDEQKKRQQDMILSHFENVYDTKYDTNSQNTSK